MSEIIEAIDKLSTSIEEKMAKVAQDAEERAAKLEEKINALRSEGNEEGADQASAAQDAVNRRSLTLGLDKKDMEKFSIHNVLRAVILGDPEKNAPFEWDLHRQLIKTSEDSVHARVGARGIDGLRAMLTTSDATGGFLIPEEIAATFYSDFKARTVRGRLGVTELTPTGIPYRVNKKTGASTAYRRGEASAVAASDIAFGQLNLTPKSVSARAVISQENVMWSNPSVEAVTQRDLIEELELKKDYDFVAGTGGSNTPVGVINTTGIVNNNAGGGSGQAPTYEVVGVDLPFLLENADALIDDGTLNYLGVPGHIKMLRKEQIAGSAAGDGAYVIPPWGLPAGAGFMPYPFITTTALQGQGLGADAGASPLFFGRWSDALHATWGGLMIKMSDTASDGTVNALTEGMVHVVVTGWDDGGVIRPASIVYDDTMDHA